MSRFSDTYIRYIKKGKHMPRKKEITIRSGAAEYLTYVASVGDSEDSIEMRYEDENIWLTQKMMATLYGVNVRTINDHIKKIYLDIPTDLLEVYKFINNIPQDVNEIARKAKLSISDVNYKIMMLQLEDKITELPGQRYILKEDDDI